MIQPVSWGPTILNDRGTTVNDIRNYVEAAYTREIGRGTLRWRTYYDAFRELDRYDYPPPTPASRIEENYEAFSGDWVGTQLTYRFDVTHRDALTLGSEVKFDLRNRQTEWDVSPVYLDIMNIDRRDRSFALFAQDSSTDSRTAGR